jgi:hypothetical protein
LLARLGIRLPFESLPGLEFFGFDADHVGGVLAQGPIVFDMKSIRDDDELHIEPGVDFSPNGFRRECAQCEIDQGISTQSIQFDMIFLGTRHFEATVRGEGIKRISPLEIIRKASLDHVLIELLSSSSSHASCIVEL